MYLQLLIELEDAVLKSVAKIELVIEQSEDTRRTRRSGLLRTSMSCTVFTTLSQTVSD